MNDLKLEPCPFCGGVAEFVTDSAGYQNSSRIIGFHISCTHCGIRSPKNYEVKISLGRDGKIITDTDGRDKAVKDWNRRDNERR